MNILIYNENVTEQNEKIRAVYPDGIHGALEKALKNKDVNVKTITLDTIEAQLTKELLDETDVMFWWAHIRHGQVPDEAAKLVQEAVLKGMGLIVLHSGHESKPFQMLMGTSCGLKWRDNNRERIWAVNPSHPIAEGIPQYFELEREETYCEFFDVPKPDDVVFAGWYPTGEIFRSGITYTRGYGRIFYFQPGHEEYPIYFNPTIIKILKNAMNWAKPTARREKAGSDWVAPIEEVKQEETK